MRPRISEAGPSERVRARFVRRFRSGFVLLVVLLFGVGAAAVRFLVPQISVSMTDSLEADGDGDGAADPGDVLGYEVVVQNTGDADALNLAFNLALDPQTELVAGSIETTPIANPDTYDAIGNVGITVPVGSGVLVNDVDPDGDAISVVAAAGATSNGGAYAIAADGSFAYTPAVGFGGIDSFSYTLRDADANEDIGTVSIDVSAVIWFIDNSTAGANQGTLNQPFNSIASFNAAAGPGPGHGIYLAETGTDYTTGIVLQAGQKLIGEGDVSADLQTALGIALPPFTSALPALGGTRPMITTASGPAVALASDNTIRGIDIGDTPVGAYGIVDAGASVGTLTIAELSISGTGGGLRAASGGVLAAAIDELTSTGTGVSGLRLGGTSGSLTVPTGSVSATGAPAVDVTGSLNLAAAFTSLTASSSGTFGVRVDGPSGSLTVSGATTITSPAGVGVRLANSTAAFTFDDVSITGRGATGITIDNVDGTGVDFDDVDVASGGATPGYGIEIRNSAAPVSFTTTDITNTLTSVAQVPAGVASGPPTNDGDGDGIFLKDNTGGLTIGGGAFTGIAGDAIDVRSSANVSISGVIVTAGAGDGFQAYNLAGNNSIVLSTITDVPSGRAGVEWYGDAPAGSASLTISSSLIDGAGGASGNVGVFVETRTNSHTATLVMDDVGGSSGDMVVRQFNGTAISVTSGSNGGAGTVNSTIQNAVLQNAEGANGQNGIVHAMNGSSSLTALLSGLTLSNVQALPADNGSIGFVAGAGAAGLLDATVINSTITGTNQEGIGARVIGPAATFDLEFSNNVLNDVERTGIYLRSDQGASGEISVQGNTMGQVTPVGGATRPGIELRVRDGGTAECGALCPTTTFAALVEDNTVQVSNVEQAVNIDIEDAANAGVTIRNNTFLNGNGLASAVEIDTEDAGSALCLAFEGNSANAAGYVLTELAGTFTVDATDLAALQGANGGTFTINGTPTFNDAAVCVQPSTSIAANTRILESDRYRWAQPDVILARHAVDRPEFQSPSATSTGPRADFVGLGAGWNPGPVLLGVGPPSSPASAPAHAATVAPPPGIYVPIGTLAPGKSITIRFDVVILGSVPAGKEEVCNQSAVSGDNFANVLSDDPDVGGAADPTCTPIDAAPDLELTKSDGDATAVPGGHVFYTLEAENTGTQAATGVTFTETVPANTVFFASGSTIGWTCADGSPAGTVCELDKGALDVGDSQFAEFAVTVVSPVPAGTDLISNTASVADDGAGGTDPTPENNSATEETPVDAMPVLAATKTDALWVDDNVDDEVNPGETLRYTVIIGNSGGEDAAGVVFSDLGADHANATLVAGSVTTTQGTVTSGNTAGDVDVSVDVGTLSGGGADVTLTFDVVVDDPFPTGVPDVCNQGTVTAANHDDVVTDDPDDGVADSPTCTMVVSNLAPEIASVDPDDQTVQYSDVIAPITITATDDSRPDGSTNLALTLEWSVDGGAPSPGLPDGLSVTPDEGDCTTAEGKECTWTISGQMLQPAGDIEIEIVVDDGELDSESATAAIEVLPEDVQVTFDGGNPIDVLVSEDGGDSGEFDLTVRVKEHDEPPGWAGDISEADVSISLVPIGPGGPEGPTACVDTAEDGPDDAGGPFEYDVRIITCTFDDVPVNTYAFRVDVNTNGYYEGQEEDVLVVYDPSLGFTTGGGWFYWPGTADGDYPGDKTNIGYNVKYNKKGTNVQGNAIVVRHLPDDTRYRMKSNALFGLSIGSESEFGWASFAGKSTYQVPLADAEGNHEFSIYVEDHGTPGAGADRFWLRITNDGIPVELSLPEPATAHAVTLMGGNIVVPHSAKGKGKARKTEIDVPEVFALQSAYPNPFNPQTTLTLDLPEDGPVSVAVFDLLGRRVRVLVDGVTPAGSHPVIFDAGALPSGIYIVVADTPGGRFSSTVTLLK